MWKQCPSTYLILFYTKRSFKKKFNIKSYQNIHEDVPNCTFFQNILTGECDLRTLDDKLCHMCACVHVCS